MTFFSFNRLLITSEYMNNSTSNTIEQIIHDRIQSTKVKMEKTNLRTETDRLWVQVERPMGFGSNTYVKAVYEWVVNLERSLDLSVLYRVR